MEYLFEHFYISLAMLITGMGCFSWWKKREHDREQNYSLSFFQLVRGKIGDFFIVTIGLLLGLPGTIVVIAKLFQNMNSLGWLVVILVTLPIGYIADHYK
jgi:amino acid transporter